MKRRALFMSQDLCEVRSLWRGLTQADLKWVYSNLRVLDFLVPQRKAILQHCAKYGTNQRVFEE